MRIQDKIVSSVAQVYSKQIKTEKTEKSNLDRINKKDEVVFSSKGREIQAARQAVYQAPDVRADKVAEIKAKINAGTYNVSSKDIAAKILDGWS